MRSTATHTRKQQRGRWKRDAAEKCAELVADGAATVPRNGAVMRQFEMRAAIFRKISAVLRARGAVHFFTC